MWTAAWAASASGGAVQLRDYQTRAIADLRAAYAAGRRAPCLVLPTGGGKTIVAAAVVSGAVKLGNPVLFLAHRAELIDQTVSKLELAGITDLRVIRAASDLGNPLAPVTVASIQTLTRWTDRMPTASLVVFDECHHVVAPTWQTIADRYSTSRLLGMTATPQRGDGRPLGDVFDSLVVGASVKELVALGHLVSCRVWAPPRKLDIAQIAISPVDAYLKHADDQRAVVFCSTLEHAEQTAAELSAAGVPAGVVHGGLAAIRRSNTLARFRAGELRAVCNVHVLTEGWDDPGCSVCILTRKPMHAGTFLQMVGRVLRPAPGKTQALLLDLCGSVHDHGTPDSDRAYALDGKGITRSEREPIRQCPTCGSVFIATADGACPQCGCELPRKAIALPQSIGVGLSELPSRPARPMKPIVLASKYPGLCRTCRAPIRVGDRIAWAQGQKPEHETCWLNAVMGAA